MGWRLPGRPTTRLLHLDVASFEPTAAGRGVKANIILEPQRRDSVAKAHRDQ
jgi:hypothetical protein